MYSPFKLPNRSTRPSRSSFDASVTDIWSTIAGIFGKVDRHVDGRLGVSQLMMPRNIVRCSANKCYFFTDDQTIRKLDDDGTVQFINDNVIRRQLMTRL